MAIVAPSVARTKPSRSIVLDSSASSGRCFWRYGRSILLSLLLLIILLSITTTTSSFIVVFVKQNNSYNTLNNHVADITGAGATAYSLRRRRRRRHDHNTMMITFNGNNSRSSHNGKKEIRNDDTSLSLSSSSLAKEEEDQNNNNNQNANKNQNKNAAPVQWEQLNALTLAARDMRKSVDFYVALGLIVTYGGGTDDPFTTLEPPLPASSSSSHRYNLAINLVNDPEYSPSTTSIESSQRRKEKKMLWWGRCIIHVSDVDGMYEKAIEHGYAPEFAPRNADWGERYFHILDPSGHELAFAKRL